MAQTEKDIPDQDGSRAADALFRRFRDMINAGDLREGDPLPPEREIVKDFGVSRTVVREAVLRLANTGLVDARPRYRPVVRKPDFDTAMETVASVVARLLHEEGGVRNLFDTRIMIEAALVRQAATFCPPDQMSRLDDALAANGAAIEDSEAFYRSDIAFHHVFYEIPQNPILPAIQRAYASWLEPQWSRMPRLPERNRTNFASHGRILDAIKAGDPDAAEAALRGHLDDAWAQVSNTFDKAENGA